MNLDPSYNTDRNNRGRSKKEKEADDNLSGLKDIKNASSLNEDLPVVFAAVNLTNLPTADNGDVNNDHARMDHDKRLELMELQMIEVLQSRTITALLNTVYTPAPLKPSKHDPGKQLTATHGAPDWSNNRIACENCNQWYHRSCAFLRLSSFDRLANTSLVWICICKLL